VPVGLPDAVEDVRAEDQSERLVAQIHPGSNLGPDPDLRAAASEEGRLRGIRLGDAGLREASGRPATQARRLRTHGICCPLPAPGPGQPPAPARSGS